MRKVLSLLAVLAMISLSAFAQRSVSGQVSDNAGAPVPFASIKIKSKSVGTAADRDGKFQIQAAVNDVLVITASGFLEQQVTVGEESTITITLQLNEALTEVIVTAQGIRRRPRELGYSVAKVTNDDIMVGRSPQVAQSLSGKVSGLAIYNVNNSVDPAVKIVLRGYRSLTGTNDALVVVDGLPQPPGSSTMLNLLNPNDIENISVLKGGQAATLYGSDGVNGAIVITTKKGAKGKVKVTYSNATNIENISFLPDYQDRYGSGSHYAAGFGTAGWNPDYRARMADNWRSYENQQFGDEYDGSLRPVGRTLEDGSVYELPYAAIPGVRRKIWNTGLTTNNQVSVSGGNELNQFYLSLENNLAEGIVPEDKSKRTGVRLAASTEQGRLKAGFNLSYVQADYDRTTFDFYNESINQAAHIPLSELRDWRNNKFASPNAYYNDYFTNPYFRLDNDRTKYGDANISGNFEVTYKLFEWMNVYNRLSVMNNTRNTKNTVGKFTYSPWAKNDAYVPDPWDQGDGEGITRTITDLAGSVYDGTRTENIVNNEFQLQMNKEFGIWSIKSVLGFSLYDRKTKVTEVSSGSIVVPEIYNVGNRQGELGGGSSRTEYRKFGYYADVLAGWKDMIFVHGSFRYDGTSKFFKPTRPTNLYMYPYYGVDVSANMTDLLKINSNWLNYAKLRAGYSKNINDNISLYGLDPTFPNSGGFPYGNTVGFTVGDVVVSPDLKPETVESFEIGTEMQLFNDRINLDFTYYTQRNTDQVIDVRVPRSTGYGTLRLNVGETKNWGFETEVRGQVIRGEKFSWELSVRYSMNDNEVVDLYPNVSQFQLSGYTYAGSYVIDNLPFPYVKAIGYIRDPVTNRVVVNSASGYPISNGPLKDLGRALPKHILGWGTKASLGDLTLSANFEYRGGNVMYNDLGRQMTFTGSGGWTEGRDPFIFPNSSYDDGSGKFVVNNDVYVREPEYTIWVDHYRLITENFTVPAWFIKLRDVNLSYNVPQTVVSRTKIFSNISLALYGRNLFTIVDSQNTFSDPEYSFTTGNGLGVANTGQTPPVRQYGINLNVTFK
jgi:TonB-linked SusC/RagA family outer membrane protein